MLLSEFEKIMTRPRRANIGRNTRNARRQAAAIASETDEEREERLNTERERSARSRSRLSNSAQERDNYQNQLRMSRNRATRNRSNGNEVNLNERIRRQTRTTGNLELAAFNYNSNIDYSLHRSVLIGAMDEVCQYCNALKFKEETPGMCCSNGKVKLPTLNPPPEPLSSLVSGVSPESKHFLSKIQQYNSCFQMTSFGATNIVRDNGFMTFKVISAHGKIDNPYDTEVNFYMMSNNYPSIQIQGQVYHKIGSLLPFPDSNYQFLQMYFMGNSNAEIEQRYQVGQGRSGTNNVRREIIEWLQHFFHDKNELVRLFQTALERMPSDSHKVIIRADKIPDGMHPGRFNAPTVDEVAVVIVGQEFNRRDIVLYRRNQQLENVSETHRCYDALQYPIIFWEGEDGYHFNIKMINPTSG